MIEELLLFLVYTLIGIWIVSLIINVFYFLSRVPNELEKACFNKSRSFQEAFEDLAALEKIKACKFSSARNKIAFYEENAKLTRRKYIYYSDRIEEGYIRLYLGRFLRKREVFSRLDLPVKFHFAFVLLLCAFILLILCSLFVLLAYRDFSIVLIVVGSIFIALFAHFFVYIISINCAVFYGIINLILYLSGVDRSKLFKNTGILDFLTSKWKAFNMEGMAIGAATIGSFHSYSAGGAGGFGGFGGGSFGGGGAGGSW